MLYERWLKVARDRGDTLALWELHSKRKWTFSQLARACNAVRGKTSPFAYPQGHSAEFILSVLTGWRSRAVVCPLEAGQKPPYLPPPPAPCCHLKITSGTSGDPRFVAFTANQLTADARNIVQTMGLRPDWPNLAAISMAHSYGFSNLVLPLLLFGIPLVIVPSPLPEIVRHAALNLEACTLAGVPALWRTWHEARAIGPTIRLGISAGALLPLKLEQALYRQTDLKIHNFYGTSETGGIAYDTTSVPRTDEGVTGQPLPNVSLALNSKGCLEVRSPAVGQTYWPIPNRALEDGRFSTQDFAELRPDGVYLRGRAGDQISVAGRKLSPATVERVLRQHPAVTDCVVFGVPSRSADRGEIVVASVVALGKPDSTELRAFLLHHLPTWQIPRKWWFVPTLTANGRGKLPRAQLKRQFLLQNG